MGEQEKLEQKLYAIETDIRNLSHVLSTLRKYLEDNKDLMDWIREVKQEKSCHDLNSLKTFYNSFTDE